MMKFLYILLVLGVLTILAVSIKAYLHIKKHSQDTRDTDTHDTNPPSKGGKQD